mmetsp:Transcript_112003/g.281903  ORF Transcript_112003/g.281903 Transcript_112003/m.281903 type:complete len:325 (-) Transcript_112003:185-1159(-)
MVNDSAPDEGTLRRVDQAPGGLQSCQDLRRALGSRDHLRPRRQVPKGRIEAHTGGLCKHLLVDLGPLLSNHGRALQRPPCLLRRGDRSRGFGGQGLRLRRCLWRRNCRALSGLSLHWGLLCCALRCLGLCRPLCCQVFASHSRRLGRLRCLAPLLLLALSLLDFSILGHRFPSPLLSLELTLFFPMRILEGPLLFQSSGLPHLSEFRADDPTGGRITGGGDSLLGPLPDSWILAKQSISRCRPLRNEGFVLLLQSSYWVASFLVSQEFRRVALLISVCLVVELFLLCISQSSPPGRDLLGNVTKGSFPIILLLQHLCHLLAQLL